MNENNVVFIDRHEQNRPTITGRRDNAVRTAKAIVNGLSYKTIRDTMEHLKKTERPAETEDAEAYLMAKFWQMAEDRQKRDDYTEVYNNDIYTVLMNKEDQPELLTMLERQIDTAYLQGYIAGALDRDAILREIVIAVDADKIIE